MTRRQDTTPRKQAEYLRQAHWKQTLWIINIMKIDYVGKHNRNIFSYIYIHKKFYWSEFTHGQTSLKEH